MLGGEGLSKKDKELGMVKSVMIVGAVGKVEDIIEGINGDGKNKIKFNLIYFIFLKESANIYKRTRTVLKNLGQVSRLQNQVLRGFGKVKAQRNFWEPTFLIW